MGVRTIPGATALRAIPAPAHAGSTLRARIQRASARLVDVLDQRGRRCGHGTRHVAARQQRAQAGERGDGPEVVDVHDGAGVVRHHPGVGDHRVDSAVGEARDVGDHARPPGGCRQVGGDVRAGEVDPDHAVAPMLEQRHHRGADARRRSRDHRGPGHGSAPLLVVSR
jgi:hypothetical protein